MKVGVILPLGSDGKELTYPMVRERALAAEAAGLDSVWIYDHLFYHFPDKEPQGVWEAMTVWSGLAEATSRVELGALVLCTAFRNPAVLAKMAVTLDHISDHRLILGLGAGWHEPEFRTFGISFSNLVDRFEEACSIIVPLVKDGKVDFTGEHYSAPDCQMLPASNRPGGIPVLIAAFKPRMMRMTARFADQYNTAWHGDVAGIAENRAAMEAACREEGRDPATMTFTAGLNVQFTHLATGEIGENDPKKKIAGDVQQVGAALRAYIAAGVDHVICNIDDLSIAAIDALAEATAIARA